MALGLALGNCPVTWRAKSEKKYAPLGSAFRVWANESAVCAGEAGLAVFFFAVRSVSLILHVLGWLVGGLTFRYKCLPVQAKDLRGVAGQRYIHD